MTNFLKALAVFAGTIIGVGIFGLPYVTFKAGFWVSLFYFFVLTVVVIIIHLFFGEISLGTKGVHRLPGYAKEYLGQSWKKIAFLSTVLGIGGALLAYLIVGGEFLKLFFSPYFGGSNILYTLIYFSFGAFLIFRGIKSISYIELSLLFVFFILLFIFLFKALPFINLDYFQKVDWRYFTLPYGVIIFSLWGSSLVPELKEMVEGNKRILKQVIVSGIVIAALTYLVFIFIIFGASGPRTSEEAISGFAKTIGDNIVRLGFIFGIITTFTSFITLGLTLKKIFWYDFGLSKNLSWFIACFSPLLLFLLGLREFIEVIGVVGAVMIGAEGIIIVLIYKKFLERRFSRINSWVWLLAGLFCLGVFFEITYFLLR